MKAWGIKAIRLVETKKVINELLITKRVNQECWMLISGMSIGMFSNIFKCDCLANEEYIIKERILLADAAKAQGLILSYEIIKFTIEKNGIETNIS